MNLQMFQNMLLAMYQRKPPILSLSGPGLGKTAIHRQTAKKLSEITGKNWKYVSLVLSNYDHFDIPGYNVPQRTADGRFVSLFTEPFFWDAIKDADGIDNFVILHLDEIADCGNEMQKLAAQMVFDRRVGMRHLPPGVWPLLSGNRRKDKSGVQKRTSMFQNRLVEVELEYDLDVHLAHEVSIGMNPLALAFLKAQPGMVHAPEVPKDPGPFSSCRSFEEGVLDLMELAKVYNYTYPMLPGLDLSKEEGRIAQKTMQGRVGDGVAAAFWTHMKYADQLPTMEEIILDPSKAKVPESMGGQFMTAFMVAQAAKDQGLAEVVKYINRMKVEMQIITMKNMFERRKKMKELPTLTATPGVSAWCAKHEDVLVLSSEA